LFALILAAFAVGIGNFAVSIGIGLTGVDTATRLKVGLIFAVFESGMPLIGLLIGHNSANLLGDTAPYAGGALLIFVGGWTLLSTFRGGDDDLTETTSAPLGRLLLTGLALSIDNLVVGFSLGIHHQSLVEAIVVFALVTILLTAVGLEFGRRLGAKVESGSEYLAGGVLVIIGVLVALRVL
jgi:putative Mn2+ efflux pump MntP